MIAEWMVRALVTTVLVGLAASLAEMVTQLFGRSRRWVWAAAMGIAILLPAAAYWFPTARLQSSLLERVIPFDGLVAALLSLPPSMAAPGGAASIGAVDASRSLPNQALLVMWLVTSTAIAAVFLAGQLRMRSAKARWSRAQVEGVPVLVAQNVGPAVVGVVQPTIVLPAWVLALPEESRRLIMRHESEHVSAGDSRLLAGGLLLAVAMPWNVALWWLYRRLRWAVEADCDARVVAAGADVRSYCEMLLAAAGRWTDPLHLSPTLSGHLSLLERRISAMTSAPRSYRSLRAFALVGAIAILGVAACDAAKATDATMSPAQAAKTATLTFVAAEPADSTGQVKIMITDANGAVTEGGPITLKGTLRFDMPGDSAAPTSHTIRILGDTNVQGQIELKATSAE